MKSLGNSSTNLATSSYNLTKGTKKWISTFVTVI